MRQIIREYRPDVTVAIMAEPSTLLGFARTGLDGVFIGTEHSHPPFYTIGRIRTMARNFAYGMLDTVVSLTAETARWHESNTRVRRSVAIPNALVWPLPLGTPQVETSSFKKPCQKLVLGVGRLCYEKGFDRLIEAFAKIAPGNPDWVCVILGEGEKRSELEAQIGRLEMHERIHLAGRVGNLSDWYTAADLCVCTSRVEGFSNVLVEAMAHGTPCIAFDCDTGPRDIITPDMDGELVPEGDVVALESGLSRLMGDPARRAAYAKAGIGVKEKYSEVAIYSRWDGLFAELAEKTTDQSPSRLFS